MPELSPKISIIICTNNRAEHLRQTLASLESVRVPPDMPTELLLVDNGSTDHTAEIVKGFKLSNMPLRYLYEPRRGKGYAYNAGLAAAKGEVLLCTDDDVRLPPHWIEGMCAPILSGQASLVVGGVKISPHLERPWMEMVHRMWLASTDRLLADHPEDVVGANMAFSSEVLQTVPGFDPELGPGGLGCGEESLFCAQLKKAGYQVVAALDVVVEHHFDAARLAHKAFIERARRGGQTYAYLKYHWRHETVTYPRLRLLKALLKLGYLRLKNRPNLNDKEGAQLWEMSAVESVHFYKQYLKERKRPFNYERFGLERLDGAAGKKGNI
ncbi:MAG TPA: glycosyltransferase family 2 protein [Pyrinomonadaceae bacterium]